ncbi:MAG: universal stress protein [Porticoccaceae bacterium]|nr:universal stress protein [Porticoccaceae bacterium]
METVTVCIDGSAISGSVCDAATWASTTLQAPLKFLHVLEKTTSPAKEDLSGAIGLGSREHLLDQLIDLDEKRGKLAIEHGRHMLADAKLRAENNGVTDILLQQRHGELLESLLECEEDTRLFVIGRQGEAQGRRAHAIGSHIETVVRAIHRPILVTVGNFTAPSRFMVAYDGSPTADSAIARIAKSPLLKAMKGDVVMVGADNDDNRDHLRQATALLADSGHDVDSHLLQGNVLDELEKFRLAHNIDLKVMGAYGHSRFREFFVGSNTSKMISNSPVPLLLLR